MASNKISSLFEIKYPIIQGGMVWCSGWRLASAVSNAGGLGLIGAGSMYPDVLQEHIRTCKKATDKPFGVNVPLLYPDIEQLMEIIVREGVKIVFTSAGNPQTWTPYLKSEGIKVVHVVSSVKFAQKSQVAGVDAVVAEGFEAGGHNGREETTTFCLIPLVRQAIDIPLIAAGGIANGRGMFGALALGADAVQIGSRFAASHESSAHTHFKEKVVAAKEGDTVLTLKKITPVRLIRNPFYEAVRQAEEKGASTEELKTLLGKGRAKLGIFEGNMEDGELEIGQVAAAIHRIDGAAAIVQEIWGEYHSLARQFCHQILNE
jgi:enoyl-[acyl-carrier protein] reductase II